MEIQFREIDGILTPISVDESGSYHRIKNVESGCELENIGYKMWRVKLSVIYQEK